RRQTRIAQPPVRCGPDARPSRIKPFRLDLPCRAQAPDTLRPSSTIDLLTSRLTVSLVIAQLLLCHTHGLAGNRHRADKLARVQGPIRAGERRIDAKLDAQRIGG